MHHTGPGRAGRAAVGAAWPLAAALVACCTGCGGSTRRDGRDQPVPPTAPDHAPADVYGGPAAATTADAAVAAAAPDAGRPPEPHGPSFRIVADAGRLVVQGPDGGPTVLELLGQATLDGAAWTSGPLAWRHDGPNLVADAANGTTEWRLVVEPDATRPMLTLRVVVRYGAAVTVEREALVLDVPEATAPTVLDRALVLRPVQAGTPHLTDPWTPLEIHASTPAAPLTVLRAAGFPSAVTEATDDGLRVRLELDDAGNHPFRPYAECSARYARNHPRETLDATPRRAGERMEHAAELWLGATTPLRAGRHPAGRRAAVVFTSHADQASAPRTRAVLWGHSDPAHETYGRRGLLGHGLSLTLTAFAADGVQDDLTDPDYAAVLAEASAAGVEVGPHSVTSGPDDRATVERLLPAFDRFAPATWIDHQPDTNCEAVMNAPALPGRDSPYELAGLLRAHAFRYLWTEPDVEPSDGGLNLLDPRRADRRPVVLFRNLHYRDGDWVPWMFRTAWLFVDRETLAARLAPAALDRLAAEQGVLLAHVYLEAYETSGRRADRALVEPDGAGFRVRDDADAVFAALGEAQSSGTLWVPALRDLGDHWTAAAEVRVVPRPDGTVTLRGGARGVEQLTCSVPLAGPAVTVDGGAPDGVRVEDGGTTFWVGLPAGGERVVAVVADGEPVPLYPAGRTVAE
jgi:hypothetical protein